LARPSDRIWLALAAVAPSKEELHRFIQDVALLSEREILERIHALRGESLSAPATTQGGSLSIRDAEEHLRGLVDSVAPASKTKIAKRVEQLLRVEGGLSVPEACAILLAAFPNAHGRIPTGPGKKSFSKWVERLLAIVPETIVLQFVQAHLGSKGSGRRQDWTLGRST
jgi:hypothetical protein